jgi:hypothetical protein
VGLVAPVLFLTLSVVDGTDAIWAQIVGVVLVIVVAGAAALVRWMWPGHRRLRFALESAVDVSGTARGVLLTSASASWRRCFDRRSATVVNCAQVHSSEYFATGSVRRATPDECLAAAETYLDQLPVNVADDLIVSVLPVPTGTRDPARCSIDARGNHLLTGTVRSLGSRPVPVQTT